MSRRVRSNRRPVRLRAAFVALLYVFLGTFGTLTHTHGARNAASAERAQAQTKSGHPLIVADDTAPADCAFCSWQANSVSAAMPLFAVSRPVALGAIESVCFRETLHSLFLTCFSSRAPPA